MDASQTYHGSTGEAGDSLSESSPVSQDTSEFGGKGTHGVTVLPGADDVLARSEDVDQRPVVRERSALVEDGAGSDGDHLGDASRGRVDGVDV